MCIRFFRCGMTDPLKSLKELVYLAHEHKNDDSRRALLRRVTDVFLDAPGSYTQSQSRCFGAIMEKLAYDLERRVREELARRIGSEAAAPRSLVRRLASDEISVARPVLEQSPVLTEDDLVEVSRRSSQEHLLAVSKRMDIGVRLAAVLVDHGRDDVVESLVRNEWAKIAPETVRRVAERAPQSQELQAALVEREDVPRDIMIGLLEYVSDHLKATILDKLTDADRENLDQIIGAMREEIESGSKAEAERYIEDLARRGALDEQVLLRFVFENRPIEFLLGLAKLLRLDALTVQRVITDRSGQGLIVACRASGLSAAAFKEIAVSPMTAVSSDLEDVLPLVRVYRRLTEDNALRAMRYWQTRKLSRRSGQDRRSGTDTRSEEERRRLGERRSGEDRRSR